MSPEVAARLARIRAHMTARGHRAADLAAKLPEAARVRTFAYLAGELPPDEAWLMIAEKACGIAPPGMVESENGELRKVYAKKPAAAVAESAPDWAPGPGLAGTVHYAEDAPADTVRAVRLPGVAEMLEHVEREAAA